MEYVSTLEALSDLSQFILHPWKADGIESGIKMVAF
jgi:hypothetical protein